MMVISVCVNECIFYTYYLKAVLVNHVTFSHSVDYKDTKQVSVLHYVGVLTFYQLMKLRYLTVKPKMLFPYFLR